MNHRSDAIRVADEPVTGAREEFGVNLIGYASRNTGLLTGPLFRLHTEAFPTYTG
jgi:hypothetical protein